MVNSQTVLIADDDRNIRDVLRLALQAGGYDTLEAVDGVEAVDHLLLSKARLVTLLDVMMPNMTGFDVLAVVATDAHLSVWHAYILMTANPDAIARAGARLNTLLLRLHVPILRKPFDLRTLLEKVAQAASRLSANP